ncbi:beta-ketoacyl synthase [Frankia sp. R82]|uniref:beta-ketoacyl synthase n=1 Tax=Frankia sp. R82 TaxID=2950553 RepID=UPI0020449FBE|nr:beta-ketoacyl synthase [Frankia sp. R82]MCM3883225.1 beta-ketoacyl synthase [Frankia sp. R82]
MPTSDPSQDRPVGTDIENLVVEIDELGWSDSAEAAATGGAVDGPGDRASGPAGAADRLHRGVAYAHGNALAAQQALQRVLVRQWAKERTATAGAGLLPTPLPVPRGVAASVGRSYEIWDDRLVERPGPPPAPRPWPSRRSTPKPLASSARRALAEQDLAALARGEIAAVFGSAYAQPGLNRRVALGAGRPLELAAVDRLDHRGGPAGRGVLEARRRGGGGAGATGGAEAGLPEHHLAAARQAVEVMGLYLGIHLCFADCELVGGLPVGAVPAGWPASVLSLSAEPNAATVRVEVAAVELVPLPWLMADVTFHDRHGAIIGRIGGLAIQARPRPGMPLGPGVGGTVPEFLGRFNGRGERALLSEFNIAHIADGDQAIAMGPEFARFSDVPSVRLPSGDLLLVDRVMSLTGRRGDTRGESRWRTEYDSPADAWYYRDSANAGMPNCVHMESSLQAAAFIGPYLGGTLLGGGEEPLRLRNLEGQATLLREVELRDQTISQESSVLATSITPSALLQEFAYECSLAGEPFYRGTSLFGYFSNEALNNQVGLDGGRCAPTWLELNDTAALRTVDVATRRSAAGGTACSVGQLALVDEFDVVDHGGNAGLGYLRWEQPVDPNAWYFDQHFRLDPVIPGSFGVETLLQAVQEWALDAGLDRELERPEFVVPVGATLRWKYRGQFLRSDSPMIFEVHIVGVERRPGRVRVMAEGNVWKPKMRIYRIDRMCIELRDAGAPDW